MSSEREAALVAAVLELADPSAAPQPSELAARLADHAAHFLRVVAAGVTVTEPKGPVGLAAASTEDPDLSAVLEAAAESGPGADCISSGHPIAGDDLDRQRHRWLRFVAKADALGIRAAHALPLRHGDSTVGALLLLHSGPGPLTDDHRAVAEALGSAATLGLQHERELGDAARVAQHLRTALNSHVVIEQAKGALALYVGNDVERAFAALRSHARSHGRPLAELAADVMAGRIASSTILRPP